MITLKGYLACIIHERFYGDRGSVAPTSFWQAKPPARARAQQREGWGAAVIPRLAVFLHNELPNVKGFSERNVKRMLAFYQEYRGLVASSPQAAT